MKPPLAQNMPATGDRCPLFLCSLRFLSGKINLHQLTSYRMTPLHFRLTASTLLYMASHVALCQLPSVILPAHTPLAVQIGQNLDMRVGQTIRAQLLYPVYSGNTLVLPENTILTGSVVALRPDSRRRLSARLRGDFTPFRIPEVSFTQIHLADGTALPITTGTATDGAPIYRLTPPTPRKGGFIHREWDAGKQMVIDRTSIVTAPGKADRLRQLLYSQLPWHPQNIPEGTAWTIETSVPLSLPSQTAAVTTNTNRPALNTTRKSEDSKSWIIQAYLDEDLSSATSKAGESVRATVAAPIYNDDHTIAVPVGAILVGAVTKARPARDFGRTGTLRFDFRQLVLPSGLTQNVQTSVTSVDSIGGRNLAMNSEGQVKPKPQDKILVPLLLVALAASPLHQDSNDGGLEVFRKNATASNSIGVIGFIIGTASGSANISAGFGAYGAALAIYNRWIKRGSEISFVRDTRIVIQTIPRRSEMLKATRSLTTPTQSSPEASK